MRFVLTVELDGRTLPVDYRRKVMSYFKAALTQYESGKYFDRCYGPEGKKDFSFGVALPKPKFKGDVIELSDDKIKIIFATPNNGEGVIFFNSFLSLKNKGVKVGDSVFTLAEISLVRNSLINRNSASFKIVSPICLRKHQQEGNRDRYVSVASDDFVEVLKEDIFRGLSRYKPALVQYVDALEVDADQCKKTVVNHYGQYIECTLGVICFRGEPILLNAIGEMNLGGRKGSGFGLLTLLHQEEVK